jgi:hypothetical protein
VTSTEATDATAQDKPKTFAEKLKGVTFSSLQLAAKNAVKKMEEAAFHARLSREENKTYPKGLKKPAEYVADLRTILEELESRPEIVVKG